jgi:hypothetical protein
MTDLDGTRAVRVPPRPHDKGRLPRLRALLRDGTSRRVLLTAVFVLALSAVPGVGTLGYFGAFTLTPWAVVLGVRAGLHAVTTERAYASQTPHMSARRALLRRVAGEGLAFVLVSLLAFALAGLWNPTCDPLTGVGFVLLLPALSWLAAATCGVVGGCWSTVRFTRVLLALAPIAATVTLGALRLWSAPVVFFFDPFFGWFSGPIYDEAVGIRETLLWFRLSNLLWITAAWLLVLAVIDEHDLRPVRPATRRDVSRLVAAVSIALTTTMVFWRADAWGFTSTLESTKLRLAGTYTTEHFVLHYDPSSNTGREIDAVAVEHEFAFERLATLTGRAPPTPIHSFIYPSHEVKRAIFGAGEVEVSLPWRGHVYLRHQPFPHASLHHELAHTFGGPHGDPVLGLSVRWAGLVPVLNMGLVEGWAEALAPRASQGMDLHDQAAVLDRLGKRPALRGIMGVGFWANSSSRAYTAAGSFLAWLHDRVGMERIGALYRSGGDFRGVIGEDLDTLEAEWLKFLRERPLDQDALDVLAQRFARRSVFQRPCAHRIAGVQQSIIRARQRGDALTALASTRELCRLEPDEPTHRLQLVAALVDAGAAAEAEVEIGALLESGLDRALLTRVWEMRGDLATHEGRLADARTAYARGLGMAAADASRRALQAKLALSSDPSGARDLLDYFHPFVIGEPSSTSSVLRAAAASRIAATPGRKSIGRLLLGRVMTATVRPDLAAEAYRAALHPEEGEPALPSPELVYSARLELLTALVKLHAWPEAREVLTTLEATPSLRSGERLELSQWRERLQFHEARAASITAKATSTVVAMP